MRKVMWALMISLSVVLVVAACSNSPTTDNKPTVAPTYSYESPKSSPTLPTREEAGKQYLRLVEPGNKLSRKCFEIATFFENNGGERNLAKVRNCSHDLAASRRKLARDLRNSLWPAEVQRDIESLARFIDAQAYAYEQVSKAKTESDYWEISVPEDNGSADIVRARLGLETRK